jgi:hypothetical protein
MLFGGGAAEVFVVIWFAFEEFGGGRAFLSDFIGGDGVCWFGFGGDRLHWALCHVTKYN